jgi:hypothetical protein
MVRKMPPANRDASELTRRRAAKSLYSFNNTNKEAVNAGVSVIREQAQFGTLDVVTQRQQGCGICTQDNNVTNGNPYEAGVPYAWDGPGVSSRY